MLDKRDLSYFENQKKENIKFWKRLGGRPALKGKTVLDFGCGLGCLSIDLMNNGAQSVTGIDLEPEYIKFAKANLDQNFSIFKQNINFEKKDLLKEKIKENFDLIVTKDTFEHAENLPEILEKFETLLKKDGKAYIGFGPLYNFYNGDHGRAQLKVPWLHVLLPNDFIIKRYNKRNKNQIKKIQDLGLSKYSLKEYQEIFKNSKFEVEFFITNQSDHPISFFFNLLSKIKFLKEYFTYNIYCILKKV